MKKYKVYAKVNFIFLHKMNILFLRMQFEQVRTFASRSRYVKSLSQGKDHFVLLDNPDTNAVNIYKYDPESRNFYSYQSIFHIHQINGIECFYTDGMIKSKC